MFSRFFAVLILLILLPFLVFISILIYIEDGYPIFYKQKRVGINNTLFNIYKFRSMKKGTPNIATHLLDNPDAYILRIGYILRKSSIDELPNLLNIVKGDMAFIGPRPALYNQFDLIELRHSVGVSKIKPGVTGWAQVNGRDDITTELKVQFDKEYLRRRSFFFDIKIIIFTLIRVMFAKGVRH